MTEQKQEQPIEKVLTQYVIENANLKIMVANLEAQMEEAAKSDEEGE